MCDYSLKNNVKLGNEHVTIKRTKRKVKQAINFALNHNYEVTLSQNKLFCLPTFAGLDYFIEDYGLTCLVFKT